MSGQGWYDADGNYHEGPPPQVKPVEPAAPEPSGWYDADGNFHEGLPPGLAAKRAEEDRLAAEAAKQAEDARIAAEAAARPAPAGWYDADGNYHEGPPPGLATQTPNAAVSQTDSQPIQLVAQTMQQPIAQPAVQQPVAQQAPPAAAPPQVVIVQPAASPAPAPVVTAAAPAIAKASGGAKAALTVLLIALVASLTALAMSLMGMFSLASIGLGAVAGAEPLPAQQLALVPAGQDGYTSWRIKPIGEPSATPPEVLAKSVSGPASPEPVATTVTAVTGDRPDSYAVSSQACYTGDLRKEFEQDPARAEAWVAALNSDETLGWPGALKTEDLWAYTVSLTFVVLLADTQVTAHGQSSGVAFPTQSVLQAGTLVGVDRFGVPRIRCVTGEPLTVPTPLESGSVQFTGQQWQGFDAAQIVSVAPASSMVDRFDVRFVGASNVEAGTIAATTPGCSLESCPAPGPGVLPPQGGADLPPGLVIPAAPAQCEAVDPDKKADLRIVNLSGAPILAAFVMPDTCATFNDKGVTFYLEPGQMIQTEMNLGTIVQIGNGTDATPLDTINLTEAMVYGIK